MCPQEETTNKRDLTYSAWHRRQSTSRFIGMEKAQLLAMIDIDAALYVEFDDLSREPVGLIEVALERNKYKAATVTRNLALRASLPSFVVLYTPDNMNLNPADPNWPDILKFRVKRLTPEFEEGWRELTPAAWCKTLLDLRSWSSERLGYIERLKGRIKELEAKLNDKNEN